MPRKRRGFLLSMYQVLLPLPPTANQRLMPVYQKGHLRLIKSTAYRKWQEACVYKVKSDLGQFTQLTEDVHLTVIAHFPDRRTRDLDNLLKGTCDVLTMAGVYDDDSHITDIHIQRGEIFKNNGTLELQITGK